MREARRERALEKGRPESPGASWARPRGTMRGGADHRWVP